MRLWLVFVLHAFSVGAFAELYGILVDGNLVLFGGLLGLALCMGLLLVGYLGIQQYVYVSFSVSFGYYCFLGWYRGYTPAFNSWVPSSFGASWSGSTVMFLLVVSGL